jgi:hypothetical protein
LNFSNPTLTNNIESRHESSFRDPSGYLFTRDGILYRQVNNRYKDDFELLMKSGLYSELVDSKLLIPHEEVAVPGILPDIAYLIIRPETIPFISYPYEWSFSQLKDAALLTLELQERALSHGLILKDASAYNIQFLDGKPVLIDTLSFEKYEEGQLWVAYRQFCQHFLAPLALMHYRDIRLSQLLRIYIDGIPLDLASELLPFRTRTRLGLLTHLHLHARSEKKYETRQIDVKEIRGVSKNSLIGLTESLKRAVNKLRWAPEGTEWAEYEKEMNYTDASLDHKKNLVSEYLDLIKPRDLWDMGANTGVFSRIAAEKGIMTVALDVDPACVELNYQECRKNGDGRVLPMLVDFANPSPGIGWSNRERFGLLERGPVDAVLALALVHHLAISNNVPLPMLAEFLSSIARYVIIEFVPKTDSQVQRLLLSREDIFDEYTLESFKAAFAGYFKTLKCDEIAESERVLFLMERSEG